jgi:hypothetical protein
VEICVAPWRAASVGAVRVFVLLVLLALLALQGCCYYKG